MSTIQSNNDTTSHVWSRLKFPTLKAATEVRGLSTNHKWIPETWWWNEQVDHVVQDNRSQFKISNSLMKVGKTTEALKARELSGSKAQVKTYCLPS